MTSNRSGIFDLVRTSAASKLYFAPGLDTSAWLRSNVSYYRWERFDFSVMPVALPCARWELGMLETSDREIFGKPAAPKARWSALLNYLFAEDRRSLLRRSALAAVLFVTAVGTRDALHLIMPGTPVRYLTFFPALLTAGFLCGAWPSVALVSAFALIGFFWSADSAPIPMRLLLTLTFVISGAAVVTPAIYAVGVRRLLKKHGERETLIKEELRHRLRNLLAIVNSICTRSIRSGVSQEEISLSISGRIQALASALDFLSITPDGSDFHGLIERVLTPLCPDPARLQMGGPQVTLPSNSTNGFALVLHELATNAVKYGAWRPDLNGEVVVVWSMDCDSLHFHWREWGSKCGTSRSSGFGTTLIKKSLDGGEVEHVVHPDGAECTIRLPLTGLRRPAPNRPRAMSALSPPIDSKADRAPTRRNVR
jgi:two-component sensor histidine kinase